METLNPILGAAAVLALWSTLMTFILVARRVGGGMKLGDLPPGMRGADGRRQCHRVRTGPLTTIPT